jgi:DNA-binding CsgD family transcriptional regulator
MHRIMRGETVPDHPRLLGFRTLCAVTEQVARRCRHYDGDERSLRIALIEDLRRRVPFRAHVWALIDPETEVATAPLATVPDPLMVQLPGLVRRRYLTKVNRWDRMDTPVASLYQATHGDPAKSLLYREVLGPAGIGDIASIVFRDRFGIWAFLDLWRFDADAPFSDAELSILAEDIAVITDALRRCQARSFDETSPTPQRPGPAVLFLTPELEVLGQTPETDSYLRALLPPEVDSQPVPAGAYNVAAALLAHEVGIHRHPPVARVRLVGGLWLTFRAAWVDSDRSATARNIAVTIELTSPAERRSLYARSHGLTTRETELLERLALGADTRTLARDLYLSEHTVQDHLKSIFEKTNTHNRRTLLSRVAGQ